MSNPRAMENSEYTEELTYMLQMTKLENAALKDTLEIAKQELHIAEHSNHNLRHQLETTNEWIKARELENPQITTEHKSTQTLPTETKKTPLRGFGRGKIINGKWTPNSNIPG